MTESTVSFSDLAIVGGCGSSGTTLLAHLVSRHPEIASGPEFNCFNHLDLYDMERLRHALPALLFGRARPSGYIDVPVFMTFREHYGINDELIRSWVERSEDVIQLVSQIGSYMRERFRGRLFFEKSPTNVYGMYRASETLPGVKLVHMIRDGRDVAPSLVRRGWNLFGAGSRWLYDTLKGLEARSADNYLELRYENLVYEPGQTLDLVLAHLGFDPVGSELLDGTISSPRQYNEAWMDRSEPKAWTQTPSDPISTKSVGTYKNVLSRDDLSMLCRIRLRSWVDTTAALPRSFGDLLDYLGYDTSDQNYGTGPFGFSRGAVQVADYWRRWKRFQYRRSWQLPSRYTELG